MAGPLIATDTDVSVGARLTLLGVAVSALELLHVAVTVKDSGTVREVLPD